MIHHEQRLAWLEKLIKQESASYATERKAALIIDTKAGSLVVPFPAIKQVIPGKRLHSLPFIPQKFCGVVDFEGTLYAIVNVGVHEDEAVELSKIVLLEGDVCSFGLLFGGTPNVIYLDEVGDTQRLTTEERARLSPLFAQEQFISPNGSLILLDVNATAAALLAPE